MRLSFQVWVVLVALGLQACASRGVYVDAASYVQSHPRKAKGVEIIRPGDRVSIRVFGEENLSADNLEVRPNGAIVLPLLGDRTVAGLTAAQLAANIKQALELYLKEPNVTIQHVAAPIVVHIMGEIGGTGRKEFKEGTHLCEVMAVAGDLSQFADRNGVYVLRQGDRIRFHYQDILRGRNPARDFVMQDGDFVVVE